MSGSFVRSFGVVVFARRPPSPEHRHSSSVGYLHCRRNEFLPVNKRVDFTTVNQATRRFRPLRHPNLCPARFRLLLPLFVPIPFFRFLSCSLFFPFGFCCYRFSLLPPMAGSSIRRGREEKLLCFIRYRISLIMDRRGCHAVFFDKIETRCTAPLVASAHVYIRHRRRSSFQPTPRFFVLRFRRISVDTVDI